MFQKKPLKYSIGLSIYFKNTWDAEIIFLQLHVPVCANLNSNIFRWNILVQTNKTFNSIQKGLVRGCSRIREGGGRGQKGRLPKICHTYSTMMKLGTVVPYLNKIQKIYKSRDSLYEFSCWYQHFFTRNQQVLLFKEIQI